MKEQHLLVDYENVQQTIDDLLKLAPRSPITWVMWLPNTPMPRCWWWRTTRATTRCWLTPSCWASPPSVWGSKPRRRLRPRRLLKKGRSQTSRTGQVGCPGSEGCGEEGSSRQGTRSQGGSEACRCGAGNAQGGAIPRRQVGGPGKGLSLQNGQQPAYQAGLVAAASEIHRGAGHDGRRCGRLVAPSEGCQGHPDCW